MSPQPDDSRGRESTRTTPDARARPSAQPRRRYLHDNNGTNAAAIVTVVSCLASLALSLPAVWNLTEDVRLLARDGYYDELEARPRDDLTATSAKLRLYQIEAWIVLPLALPFFVVVLSAAKALRFLATGRPKIGWIGGTMAVVAAVYLIPIGLIFIAWPDPILSLAPLGVALLASVVFLAACACASSGLQNSVSNLTDH